MDGCPFNLYAIYTGFSGGVNTIRLIPPLCITEKEIDRFVEAFDKVTK